MADQGKKKTSQAAEPPAEGKPGTKKAPPAPVYVGGDSIADRLMPHIKKIIVGVLVIAVAISVVFTYRWYKRRSAEKATDKVVVAMDDAQRKVVEPGSDTASGSGAATEQTYASRADRAEAALTDLQKASGGPRDGLGLFEAQQLFQAGRFDDAATAYRKLSNKPGLDGVLAREGLGFALEAKADALTGDAQTAAYNDALEAFKAMQPEEDGPRRDYGLYHEGRLEAKLGQKDVARTSFEAALEKAKDAGDQDLEALTNARIVQLDAPPLPDKPATPPPSEKPAEDAPK